MGRPSGKASAELERAQQTEQLLQRVVTGMSVSKAAEQLNIPRDTAYRLYHRALQDVYDDNSKLREETLGRELKTLEMLQRSLWPAALRGHVRSVEVMLAVMDRRAKYLGFDAATKVQVEVSRVDDALAEIVQIVDGEATATAAKLLRAAPDRT